MEPERSGRCSSVCMSSDTVGMLTSNSFATLMLAHPIFRRRKRTRSSPVCWSNPQPFVVQCQPSSDSICLYDMIYIPEITDQRGLLRRGARSGDGRSPARTGWVGKNSESGTRVRVEACQSGRGVYQNARSICHEKGACCLFVCSLAAAAAAAAAVVVACGCSGQPVSRSGGGEQIGYRIRGAAGPVIH